jgi:hypothetical protein
MQEAAIAGVVVIGAIAVFLAGFAVGIVLATTFVKRRRDGRHGPRRKAPARPFTSASRVRRTDMKATISQPDGGSLH